ncbi:MAG: penicillin-binding protein 2 [Gaiellaceae bacterium]
MNRQVSSLATFSLILIAALIVGTTYWQTWASAGLADRQDNEIQRVAQFSVKRGKIRAADGTVLAANRAKHIGGHTLYFRRYPTGPLFAQLVGYSTQSRSRAGIERSQNDYLTATNANLGTLVDKTLAKIRGATIKGNDIWLTVRPGAQRVAMNGLAGKCGAAVALDPRSGKVLVLASQPSYDPNLVEANFSQITSIRAACTPAAPLLNRATDGLFTPGSSFKVVTAAAALDSGRYTPNSTFYDPGFCTEYGKPVYNFADQSGPEHFGTVSLFTGLQHSINAVFCNLGKSLGAARILDQSKKFGFYSLPPLDTPANERSKSGLYSHNKLYDPAHPEFQVDPGRLAFGQERMLATPLQMAMVAAAVANRGVLMKPYAVDRVTAPGGGIVARTKPNALPRVMKTQTADELSKMMEAVVTGGTGTAAQIPGVRVAGKTGTAETGVSHRNTTWFICFAPADNPRVAVAVVLENQTGVGGTTSAPIAKSILEALLQGART